MQYMYGDLTKADYQDNALDLLQRVIDMSVEMLKKHQEIDNALLTMQAEKNRMAQVDEDIESLRAELMKVLQSRTTNRPEQHVLSLMGRAVTETLTRQANEGKARMKAQVEEAVNGIQAQVIQLSNLAFDALREFFMASGLPVKEGNLRCRLDGLVYRAESEMLDAAGIQCRYNISCGASEFFSGPKRFGDLVPGKQEIPLGTKKARFKKEPVLEMVRIDDAMLTQVFDNEETGEFRLSTRGGGEGDGLQVRVAKNPPGRVSVFTVVNNVMGQQIPSNLYTDMHIDLLMRFWQQLSPHLMALYQTKESLASVGIGGKDVVDGRLFAEIVNRLVRYLTPIIRDIDSHTPVDGELSLSIEHEDEGRRDVFFVRKDKLAKRIAELPALQRALFSPLDLGGAPAAIPFYEATVEVSSDIIKGVLLDGVHQNSVPGKPPFPKKDKS